MQTLTSRYVRAKKEHTCDLCHGKIEPGDIYEYQFIVDGGDSWECKAHPDCLGVAVELDAYDSIDGYTSEGLYEALRDVLGENLLDTQEMVKLYLERKEVKE